MKLNIIIVFLLTNVYGYAQELYVNTEPASNMPANSIFLRINTKLSRMNHHGQWDSYRVNPEIMFGVSKKFMLHFNGFMSNMYQPKFRFEGAGIYAKYRALSLDDIHRHFRLATYARALVVKNPVVLKTKGYHYIPDANGNAVQHQIEISQRNFEIDHDGEVSALGTGIIATQLINRLAISATAGYLYRLNNIENKRELIQPWHALNWSASAGYLLLPVEYKDYNQTNLNFYLEVLGYNSIDAKGSYIDIAPAIQFIFNSIARLDLGYRRQVTGIGSRFANSSFNVKFEYDFLNVFKRN